MPADRWSMVATVVAVMGLAATACGGSTTEPATPTPAPPTALPSTPVPTLDSPPDTPGGFDFDRSDPVGGVAGIAEAFGTDETTAACIYDAWGDVVNIAPEELTLELMNFPICGTSIFQLMTGDPRFTGREEGE